MTYVTEILQARYDDNLVQAKEYRNYLVELDVRIKEEKDLTVQAGMKCERIDIYYEYESLSKENDEILTTLKLINKLKGSKKMKRAHSSLATGRLNSHMNFKSHALL